MSGRLLHQVYEEELAAFHPYGVPLYKPVSTKILRPGSVGYFNKLGEWAPITQLDDLASLASDGFEPPEEDLKRARYKPVTNWDRKWSKDVQESDISGTSAA
jgi:hypothetical protein